jgi:hypothetical protein
MFRMDFPFMRRLSRRRYEQVDQAAAEHRAGTEADA